MTNAEVRKVLDRKYTKEKEEREKQERLELELEMRRSRTERRQLTEEQLSALLVRNSEEAQRLISQAEKRLPLGLLDFDRENTICKRHLHGLLIRHFMSQGQGADYLGAKPD